MKKYLKLLILITTMLIFIYAFSISYSSQNIDNLDYVIALGIDKIEDSNNMEISFEFADISSFSENNSSKDNSPIIDKVEASSISNAIMILNSYLGKRLNLSHCKVIVFSEEFAKYGITSEISYLMNNTQIRATSNIIVCTDKASTYIEKSTSSLEQILTKYYDIFPTSGEYTGYTSNIILGNFYKNLINSNVATTAILGTISNSQKSSSSTDSTNSNSSTSHENNSLSNDSSSNSTDNTSSNSTTNSSSESNSSGQESSSSFSIPTIGSESIIEGDRGTENVGLSIFNNGKYIGSLSNIDTLCYSILKNEVDNFLISIDNPLSENETIDISIEELSPTKISVNTDEFSPKIDITINLTGKVLNKLESVNFSDSNDLEKLNTSATSYLSQLFYSYLYKTTNEYQCDINHFYKYVKKNFWNFKSLDSYNWKESYKNTVFNVNINSDIISSRLLENS